MHDLVSDQGINESDQPVVYSVKEDLDRINIDLAANVEVIVPIHDRVADSVVIKVVLLEFKDLKRNHLPDEHGVAIGSGMAAVAIEGGAGLAPLFPAFLAFLLILKKILESLDKDDRLGEFLEGIKNELLDPNEKDPAKRAAGMLINRY